MAHGMWHMAHGTSTWHMAHGTWYMVHGTWYMVAEAILREGGIWHMAHGSTQGQGTQGQGCLQSVRAASWADKEGAWESQ